MGRAHGEWALRRLSITGPSPAEQIRIGHKKAQEDTKLFVILCAFLWLPPFDSRRKIHAARLVERARFL
jgi:hypothetical protein